MGLGEWSSECVSSPEYEDNGQRNNYGSRARWRRRVRGPCRELSKQEEYGGSPDERRRNIPTHHEKRKSLLPHLYYNVCNVSRQTGRGCCMPGRMERKKENVHIERNWTFTPEYFSFLPPNFDVWAGDGVLHTEWQCYIHTICCSLCIQTLWKNKMKRCDQNRTLGQFFCLFQFNGANFYHFLRYWISPLSTHAAKSKLS